MIKKIFVSHPFAGDPEKNKQKVDIFCKTVNNAFSGDLLLISPLHLWSFMDDDSGLRDEILDYCFYMIDGCDEVWFVCYNFLKNSGGDDFLSSGQRKEKEYVDLKSIDYMFFDLKDMNFLLEAVNSQEVKKYLLKKSGDVIGKIP